MSILPSDEQILLRESTRQFLTSAFPIDRVRTFMAGSADEKRSLQRAFWKEIAELGWLGVLWDEDSGGIGLGHTEVGIILEELGRALVPSAYLPTLLAGLLLRRALPAEECREWLESVAAGQLTLSLSLEDPLGENDAYGPCQARAEGSGFRLQGTKSFIPHAPDVDRILIAATTDGDEIRGFWVDPSAAGVEIDELETMDQTRPLYRVSFQDAEAHELGLPGQYAQFWSQVEPFYWSALASECVGGCERVLEDAVAYAKDRVQFDSPIGAQQAIKHKCANMLIRVEGTRSIAARAARALEEELSDGPLLCSMAKAYATESYREVSAEGIQIHGGVGFTWEYD
ncbi:MAG: acyl-CoA dehydrogenase family protein, partial [Myxococcota bacterium]|nr:acyl-CoA dehydrogenase family protein [Myxococcota bacterium]